MCGTIHSNARSSANVFCRVTRYGGQQRKPPLVHYRFQLTFFTVNASLGYGMSNWVLQNGHWIF